MKLKRSAAAVSALSAPDTAYLKGKAVLVTGGTGYFGRRCVQALFNTDVRKIIVFSRDELKQSEMQSSTVDPRDRVRYFLGDVRDEDRLKRAFHGVDFVIHAAALTQVSALEYNPSEAVLTNINGSQNIIDAAIDCGVKRVIALSNDKAVNPINLCGATKLCAEKLFVAGNSYAGAEGTRFSVARYGNVLGSRGGVLGVFQAASAAGVLPVTDERMTRFWITLDQAVNFTLNLLGRMRGGEILVPKIPSMRVMDLAAAVAPGCTIKLIGIRPGEKIHEILLTEDEASYALDMGSFFIIQPRFEWWGNGHWPDGRRVPAQYRYASDSNDRWLTIPELRRLAELP